MRCPWCGSGPVKIYGDRWECGWCGDCGRLKRTPEQTSTLIFVCHVDLTETWSDLKKALDQLAPKRASLSQLLGKVLLHYISVGIQRAEALPDETKAEELLTFLHTTADLNLGESAEEIMRDARQGVLFREEAALSKTDCGTFWTDLLSARPVEDYYNRGDPDGLFDLFSGLAYAYAYFGGKKDKEIDEAQDYQYALERAYNTHLENKVLLHPDTERAKRLLAQGEFPDYEDICREILLVEYPEEVPHENAEDFDELSWECILDDVASRNAAKGIQMWRCLLDIAEPALKISPQTAEKLLPDWNWLSFSSREQAQPLLEALEDERFLSQIFRSACIGDLQSSILYVCQKYGSENLRQRCLTLVLKNEYIDEHWINAFNELFSDGTGDEKQQPFPLPHKSESNSVQDDETVYHYCSVQVPGTGRTYAYLAGGLPIKVGDWVELPFGKENILRQGQVKAVMDCTRIAAPWPPEQTKTVIRTIDAPAITPAVEHVAPKIEERIKQPVKKAEKAEKPVISVPKTTPKQPKAEPQASEPAVPEKAEKRDSPLKKILLSERFLTAVLAAGVILGSSISIVNYNNQRAAVYETALQEMSEGNYTCAEYDFSELSDYRDSASLAVYCKYADIYKDSTDYAGGAGELARITLQYDMRWQKDIDALESRVEGYWKKKAAADAAEREQSLKDKYSGKLPVNGMPESYLRYTSIGSPTRIEKCRFYDNMDVYRRYKTLRWLNSDGQIIASCKSYRPKGRSEEVIEDFTYYKTPQPTLITIQPSVPSSGSSHGNTPSIRNDYDNPEDLWEDNPDWYDDEDEAWEEWYEG